MNFDRFHIAKTRKSIITIAEFSTEEMAPGGDSRSTARMYSVAIHCITKKNIVPSELLASLSWRRDKAL